MKFSEFFIPTDGDCEVCLHTLRLLQSMLVEEEVLFLLGSSLLDPDLQVRVGQLTSSGQANLRLAAQQTLEDLHGLQKVPYHNKYELTSYCAHGFVEILE